LQPALCSVNYEVISSEGVTQSVALVTADISGTHERSRLVVTVQLSSLAEDMEAGYREGFGAGLDNLAGAAERTMVLQRVIQAPRSIVWGAWMNPETLPQWWGPEGFSCRTKRIDLRTGGEWVFDMIAPDGTVFPNHHLYNEVRPEERIGYTLHWGENGPKHADAWASFEDQDGATKVTLGMVFSTAAEFQDAKGFGAVELGLQTLSKLERFVTSAECCGFPSVRSGVAEMGGLREAARSRRSAGKGRSRRHLESVNDYLAANIFARTRWRPFWHRCAPIRGVEPATTQCCC
jgi:uncharacterized protein YndB with AHSA1/START domain